VGQVKSSPSNLQPIMVLLRSWYHMLMQQQTSTSSSSSSSAPLHKTYTPEQWQKKLDAIKLSKTYSSQSPLLLMTMSDLNVLIMNYLVHQGYPSSAVSFAREANLALSKESVDSITARMKIRNKIHAGEIEGAIHDINTLNPQVFIPLVHHLDIITQLCNRNDKDSIFKRSSLLYFYLILLDKANFSYSIIIPHYIFHYYDSNSSN
jgi:LisH